MADAMADVPINEGSDQGEVDERYKWQLTVQRYEYDDEGISSQYTPYEVRILVTWRDGRHSREYELSTLRLSQG